MLSIVSTAQFGGLVLLGLVLVLALATFVIWMVQERITFQPPRPPWPSANEHLVEYRSPDGLALFGYVVGRENAPQTVIAFHGNADLAVWQIPWARELAARTGARVLVAEYRGYGGCPGVPTYAGAQLDARGAWAYVHEVLHVDASSVVLFGHSLGSAIATELASEMAAHGTPPRALILQSPFTSARDMTTRFAPRPLLVAWPLVTRVHYNTEARLRELPVPVFVAHGDDDLIIPVSMGRAVFAAARKKGEMLEVPGAGHSDVADVGRESYWRWLTAAVTG